MIADAFLFFNEFELLEIRLNALKDYVDLFVLCESDTTFTGNAKRLYFNERKSEFRDFNIKHVFVGDGKADYTGRNSGEQWQREYYQREALIRSAEAEMGDGDTLLISDADEIPDMESYSGQEGRFIMKHYIYYLNCFRPTSKWPGTKAVNKENIRRLGDIHRKKAATDNVVGGGWHFSFCCSVDDMVLKAKSYSHIDVAKNIGQLIKNRERLKDPYAGIWYGRRGFKTRIEMPDGPQWLLDNKDRYGHLFYEPC
jgi:beta-1,4-mannosyl-glycoprotein beta-1,4-N-acetylglucosaminyltransferase